MNKTLVSFETGHRWFFIWDDGFDMLAMIMVKVFLRLCIFGSLK